MRILQISDLHLSAASDATLLKLNTQQSFTEVINFIKTESMAYDKIILSGDLSQDGSVASYKKIADLMTRHFSHPIYWLAGNHDNPEVMARTLATTSLKTDKIIIEENWLILLLNSHQFGQVGGHLAKDQLTWLAQQLTAHRQLYTLVFLHHPPVKVNSAWLDQSTLANAEELFAITDQHPKIRGIICGHVHQEFCTQRKGVEIVTVPSTCIQFLPRSETFALDDIAPGFRWLDLHRDGTWQTGVTRLSQFTQTADFSATGY